MQSALLETVTRLPETFSPMQRILLTANGNVQRILSAFYNDTVTVRVLFNNERGDLPDEHLFERKVEIICRERVSLNISLFWWFNYLYCRYAALLQVKLQSIQIVCTPKSEAVKLESGRSFGKFCYNTKHITHQAFQYPSRVSIAGYGSRRSHFLARIRTLLSRNALHDSRNLSIWCIWVYLMYLWSFFPINAERLTHIIIHSNYIVLANALIWLAVFVQEPRKVVEIHWINDFS